jgi:hypothetical protein
LLVDHPQRSAKIGNALARRPDDLPHLWLDKDDLGFRGM